MFQKIVAIEPLGLTDEAVNALHQYAGEVIMYHSHPDNSQEIVERIADADAVLLSYTTYLGADVIGQCKNLRYIGMCCSLYSPESANVDIRFAEQKGISVTGVRDYGDEGAVEFVISELIQCLHGFSVNSGDRDSKTWEAVPREITGLKAGIIGFGKLGGMVADALRFFGAEISYYSRSEKEEAARKGYQFMPLNQLLNHNELIVACLNKNTILLHDEQFQHLGNRKLLFNVGLSPAWDEAPFADWLRGDNRCFCDSVHALGGTKYINHPNVKCMGTSAGKTQQAAARLSEKVLENIRQHCRKYSLSRPSL